MFFSLVILKLLLAMLSDQKNQKFFCFFGPTRGFYDFFVFFCCYCGGVTCTYRTCTGKSTRDQAEVHLQGQAPSRK
jgi:hypothetical protein